MKKELRALLQSEVIIIERRYSVLLILINVSSVFSHALDLGLDALCGL